MTTLLLIRHAAHTLGNSALPGRTPGVHLSPEGRDHAHALADRLATIPISAIYSSPLERTRETAQPLAARLDLPIRLCEALTEIDFGQWTGKTLDELRPLEHWRRWNASRGTAIPPGGEPMIEAQARVVKEIVRLHHRHADAPIALFTHGDIIHAAAAHLLGIHLDLASRIEIDLGSVTIFTLCDDVPSLRCLNHTGPLSLQ